MVGKNYRATVALTERCTFQGASRCPRRRCPGQSLSGGASRGTRANSGDTWAKQVRRLRSITRSQARKAYNREQNARIGSLSSFVYSVMKVLSWMCLPATHPYCRKVINTFFSSMDDVSPPADLFSGPFTPVQDQRPVPSTDRRVT